MATLQDHAWLAAQLRNDDITLIKTQQTRRMKYINQPATSNKNRHWRAR